MSPEFSDLTKKKIEEIISQYPQKEAALLPLLHIAQQEFGYISTDVEKLVAEKLKVPPIKVREVVTFYTMFNQQPVGKYHIQVCSNLSCSLLGADSLVDYLKEKLRIEPGQTTPDNKFTLSLVECLGSCEEAPCMQVNFDYHGDLTKKKIDSILKDLE